MVPEGHERLIRRYLEEVFNRHDLDGLDAFFHRNLQSHWLGMETLSGLPAWKTAMSDFFTAFPDATFTLDDIFFAGDRGVWRGTWHATQQADWAGVVSAGRKATWTAAIIARFAGGKMAEDWVEFDRLGLYRQLGATSLA